MFPATEELPPEEREINPASLLSEDRVAAGRPVVWLAPLGRCGLCSVCSWMWLFGLRQQLLGEKQEGEW